MYHPITPTVRVILFINVTVFLVQILLKINFPLMLGVYLFDSPNFAPWQLLTYSFVHGYDFHIISNMFTFFLFAPHLELALGQNRFLTYYLVCGLGAGVLNNAGSYAENYLKQQAIANYEQAPTAQKFIEYMATHEPQYYKMRLQYCNEYVAHHGTKRSVIFLKEIHKLQKDHHHVVGASGAVFGILMGVLLLLPNLRMPFFYFGMTFRAKHLLPISIILELFAVFGMGGASNVAHFAHLAGAFVGFLLIKFWKLKRIY